MFLDISPWLTSTSNLFLLFLILTANSSPSSPLLSGMSCIRTQFLLDYCSWSSILSFKSMSACFSYDISPFRNLILSSFSLISFSNLSNLSDIKPTEFLRSTSCSDPLIWDSLVVFTISRASFYLILKISQAFYENSHTVSELLLQTPPHQYLSYSSFLIHVSFFIHCLD